MPVPTSRAHIAPRRVLVVGAGLAGLRTAAELRARGFSGHLRVVGAEHHLPYDRPPLSKELHTRTEPRWLAQDLGADLTALADEVLLGHTATGLQVTGGPARVTAQGPGHRPVELDADVVVLACGSRALRPPGWQHALGLHTLEDAAVLRERLVPGTDVAVVGAGWIGAELAGVAAAAGCRVTVLEATEAPLSRELGPVVGALTVPWYATAGVALRLGAAVREVDGAGVTLTDGERLAAGLVVAAVGARPATDWVSGVLPLTARGAVPVDTAGRVLGGPASVRAVGDCADMTLPGGTIVPGGHWDGALQHPAGLAADLLGQEVPPPPAPYVFSTQLGHELTLFGHPSPASAVVLRGDPLGPEGWTALYVEDARGPATGPGGTDVPAGAPRAGSPTLVAGLTVDRPRDVGPLRRALSGGARPGIDLAGARDVSVPLRKTLR